MYYAECKTHQTSNEFQLYMSGRAVVLACSVPQRIFRLGKCELYKTDVVTWTLNSKFELKFVVCCGEST